MKGAFLCESTSKIFKVYDDNCVKALNGLCGIEKKVLSRAEVLAEPDAFKDTEYIFSTWGMPRFSVEEIKRYFPSLQCVFYGAGSVQSFAREFLRAGVRVFSAWAANAVPVAEFTVAQIVLSNKGYFLTNRLYRSKGNKAAKSAFSACKGNFGETVGIIGAGMVGRLVIKMLKQYKLKVIVFDPFLSDESARELGVEKCGLEELFSRAFVISNHLADNEKTKGMLGYDLFSRMRENAVFINTGRGAQVVEEELVRILKEREDISALLDVTCPEPPVEGHPFYTLPNCLLTPHIAGSGGDEVARMGDYMLNEFCAYISSAPTSYEVTEKMLETMA